MSLLKLSVDDFVNFQLEGLSRKEIAVLQKHTARPVKGAFTSAAFKAKIWDGRESLMDDNGVGVLFELNKTLDVVENVLGYDLETDMSYTFSQPEIDLDVPLIDADYMKAFSGYTYRDYQYNSVNMVIKHRKGILDIGTNGGKSWICAGISRAYDSVLKSLVIVPSENLVTQTYADYSKTDMNVVALTSSVPVKKRQSLIQGARHVIMTSKLFMNCVEFFQNESWVIIYDEAHVFGDVMADLLRVQMSHCPVRVGLTATLPNDKTDPYKRHKIMAVIGGDILVKVKQSELIERGISSKITIKMLSTSDVEMEELSSAKEFEWGLEESYLLNNMERVSAICDYIKTLDVKNTLILCHAGFGLKLAELLGCNVITDETPTALRAEWFAEFDKRDDFILAATFGCAGTGISINRIFRGISVDVGKNETSIIQGIGRMLRLDGVHNEVGMVDISAKTKYSSNHRKERIKIYKREKFSFIEDNEVIMVNR